MNAPTRVTLRRFVPARFLSSEPLWIAFGLGILVWAFAPLIQPVVQNGDAAVYTEQVQQHAFNERAIHIGYVLIGSVFRLLPMQIDRAMNVMALSFGLAALFALYAAGKVFGSRVAGFAGVLLLLGCKSYVRAMVLSEVDILSATLVMISYALYVRKQNLLAGAGFGLAMLTTPVTATFLPMFLFTFALDPRGPRATFRAQFLRVLWFGLVAMAVYLPFVVWQRQSYFFGGRSVTTSGTSPFDAMAQIERGAQFFYINAWPLIPLFCAGILSALSDRELWRRDQPGLALVLTLVLTALLADRTGDVPVHLPALALLCLTTALFLRRVASATRMVWAIPVSAFLLLAWPARRAASHEVDVQLALRERYRAMRERSQPLRAMLAGFSAGFSKQRFFEHYAYGISYTGMVPTIAELRHRLPELKSGTEQYVIYFVGNIPRDVRNALAERYEEGEVRLEGVRFRTLTPTQAAPAPAVPAN